jgi:NADP-dependent alcohol dehydrogenase
MEINRDFTKRILIKERNSFWNSTLLHPATGSEMNGAVVTIESTKKISIWRFGFVSKVPFVIPPLFSHYQKTIQNVVDAYTHVMEQYLTYPHEGYYRIHYRRYPSHLIEVGPKVVKNQQIA